METTDHWDFWLVCSLLLSCALWCRCCSICQSCRCLLHRAALGISTLALMLALIRSAALWTLHEPLPRLLLWLLLGWRSIFLCYLSLRPTTRSLFEKYLLVLLIQWLLSAWVWGHHTIIYWHVTQDKRVVHCCWDCPYLWLVRLSIQLRSHGCLVWICCNCLTTSCIFCWFYVVLFYTSGS